MRYVVGYAANERGKEAIEFAAALARAQGARLDVVVVLPQPAPITAARVASSASSYEAILVSTARKELEEALMLVPQDIATTAHLRFADSVAEGLMEAAGEFRAGLIIIGATRSGLLGRFTIGSVANALLHSAQVPVALVPRDYKAPERMARFTAAVGTRAGAQELLRTVMAATARGGLPLRLLSLVALDDTGGERAETVAQAQQHADRLMAAAKESLGADQQVSATVADGRSIEEAVEALDWEDGEVVMIGSSRLAQHRRLFLGSTANRMLRSLPVPMVVVPRNYEGPVGGDEEVTS